MGYDGEKGGIPRVVRDAIQYLRDRGEVHYSICGSIELIFLQVFTKMASSGVPRYLPFFVLLKKPMTGEMLSLWKHFLIHTWRLYC